MRYFVTGHEMLLYLSGDREEHKEECCFELPDFESKEEAVAAAREFIKEHKNAVNDIYPEDVADLPTIETAIPRLREIFAGADEIIGYNVGFDLEFLSAVGVRPREDARITDTMNEFTWFMGRRYKLVDAADHIGYEWTGRAHGSLADALATLAVQRWLEQWLVAE